MRASVAAQAIDSAALIGSYCGRRWQEADKRGAAKQPLFLLAIVRTTPSQRARSLHSLWSHTFCLLRSMPTIRSDTPRRLLATGRRLKTPRNVAAVVAIVASLLLVMPRPLPPGSSHVGTCGRPVVRSGSRWNKSRRRTAHLGWSPTCESWLYGTLTPPPQCDCAAALQHVRPAWIAGGGGRL